MKILSLLTLLVGCCHAVLPVTALNSPAAGGSGITQFFQVVASDSAGVQDIAATWLIFTNDGATYANGCGIRWVPAENGIQILNDAGNLWSSSVTMGSSAVLSNSQCSVPASSAYKTNIGNNYYFAAVPTFKPAFYGPKTMLGLSSNVAGQFNPTPYNLGLWSTGAANYPSTFLVSPVGGGSGSSGTFTFGSTSGVGASDIATSWLIFTPDGGYANACGVLFEPPSNTVFLLNDAGTDWGTGVPIGSAGTKSNSQCSINTAQTSRVVVGATSQNYSFTVNFTAAFGGSKAMIGLSSNVAGQFNPIPYNLGGWVTGTANYPSTFLVSTPPAGGSTFAFGSTSGVGASDIATSWLIFTPDGGYANACGVLFEPPSNMVFLLNDAGTDWGTGVPIGSSGTLTNSQCSLDAAQTSRTVVGAVTQNYTFTVNFKAAFSGTKSIIGLSSNLAGQFNPAYSLGNWTIPTMAETIESHLYTSIESGGPSIDGYTGLSGMAPSADNPAPVVSLMGQVPGGIAVFEPNQAYQIAIRFAPPNSQVWARETSLTEHQTMCPVYIAGQPTFGVTAAGACRLVGQTDANGFYLHSSNILPLANFHAIKFWIGNQTANPNDPNQNTTLTADDTKAIGAAVFFIKGANGQPPYPPFN